MADTTLPGLLATGDHASRPAASAVGTGALYSCTDHDLVYQSDGATWSTWATLGGTGLADQGAFTYLDATEAAAPSTPASGKVRVYAKSDGRIYSKDDAGTEYGPFDTSGGSDPRDFPAAWTLDDVALGGGVLFNEAAGTPTGLTVQGTINTTTEMFSVPGLDVILDGGDHFKMSLPSGDIEVMLHFSDTANNEGMFGVGFVNTSGNGHCFVQYQNNLYQMGATGWVYSGTGGSVGSQTIDTASGFAHQWILVKRVGTTLTARMSRDGSTLSSATGGVTNSTCDTIAVGRWYGSNGGKKVRMHRIAIAQPDFGL